MSNKASYQKIKNHGFWLLIICTIGITALCLRGMGRLWWCACGLLNPWWGEAWSSHTSQHLFDPYSFTHILHGFLFCALLNNIFRSRALGFRLWSAVFLESLWEILENSPFIIARYRSVTASIGYSGDTVFNSIGDIICCTLGFIIANKLGFRRSLFIFLFVEVLLLLWIRDSLILNIIMLIHPFVGIKNWQIGRI